MTNYLLITISSILCAISFSFQNKYQKIAGNSQKASMLYNLLLGLFSVVILFVVNGFKIEITPYSAVMSFLCSFLVLMYTVIGFKILKLGGMTLFTLFLMSGGMIVPYVWGLLFLDESFSVLRTVGLICVLAAVVLSNTNKNKGSFKLTLLCISIFFINGFTSVVSKVHQVETVYETVSTDGFVMLMNIAKVIMCVVILGLGMLKKEDDNISVKKIAFTKGIFGVVLLSAICGIVGSVALLRGAKELPATVLYPFSTGGTIIFSSMMDYFAFKEKLTKRLIASVVICFTGTLLFL